MAVAAGAAAEGGQIPAAAVVFGVDPDRAPLAAPVVPVAPPARIRTQEQRPAVRRGDEAVESEGNAVDGRQGDPEVKVVSSLPANPAELSPAPVPALYTPARRRLDQIIAWRYALFSGGFVTQ
jgi:hypothetical protein